MTGPCQAGSDRRRHPGDRAPDRRDRRGFHLRRRAHAFGEGVGCEFRLEADGGRRELIMQWQEIRQHYPEQWLLLHPGAFRGQ